MATETVKVYYKREDVDMNGIDMPQKIVVKDMEPLTEPKPTVVASGYYARYLEETRKNKEKAAADIKIRKEIAARNKQKENDRKKKSKKKKGNK